MMDRKTEEKIRQINRSIPKELTKNMVTTKRDTSEHELAEQMMKDRNISSEGRRALEKAVSEGSLIREEKVYDEKKSQEISKYLDGKIKSEMSSGRLKPAKEDEWMRKMRYEQSKLKK